MNLSFPSISLPSMPSLSDMGSKVTSQLGNINLSSIKDSSVVSKIKSAVGDVGSKITEQVGGIDLNNIGGIDINSKVQEAVGSLTADMPDMSEFTNGYDFSSEMDFDFSSYL